MSLRKIFSIFFRISVSIILLAFLFKQIDKRVLLATIKNVDKSLLFLAFFIFFINYILCLFRWEMLLKTAKIYLPFKRVIISFAGGTFFSLFLPSTIGGDFVRSLDLAIHTKRPREVVATVFLDRLSGYIGLVIVALLAVFFGSRLMQDKNVFISVAIITTILIVVLLILFNKFLYSKINQLLHSSGRSPAQGKGLSVLDNIRESLKNLHQEIHIFRHQKKVILQNLVLSLFIQAINPITFYVIALSLGIKMNIIYFFVYLPIIGAITLLPISIGGLGLRDATTIFFFAKAGLAKDLAFAMSLLSFFFILIYGILGGLIYVFTVHHRRIQHYKSPCIYAKSQQN